ncbi:hypothetical protein VTH8203_01349 [Vibrio thalassae]|uniref:Transglycosylase SLT domain-containing protein n=1 Tax=Vibrio thalassae TaxID=1243014 RepID=A0A240EGD2_9VIBR|nr:hypothetical protein VTH8203_01349 [Vibrio thalassae]
MVLYALSVQETNTKMVDGTVSPWPYTINHKRKAFFYATEAEMLSKARSLISQGYHSFDVGPFQVNWKWNGHRARSIEDLGNVHRNGIIAAEILMEHYKKYGNWIDAAGRYHNPANKNGLADKYKKEFREKLAMIESGKYQRLAQKNE